MNILSIGTGPRHPVRKGLVMFSAATALAAAAQTSPLRYQHCELERPTSNAAHRMESNYRYPPAASIRSLQGVPSYRCEAAWAQSPAVFDAVGVCPFNVIGCSADASGTCNNNPDDWVDYEFLGASLWSDSFMLESAWPQNPLIKLRSQPKGVQQWTQHRWWGWDFPPRYRYLGVAERQSGAALEPYPKCYGMAYVVGFFNGVWNTDSDAEQSLKAFRRPNLIGSKFQGSPVKYQLFYNQTGCSRNTVACIDDVSEVFIQRSEELDGLLQRRWEYFWEQIHGRADKPDSWTGLLRSRVLLGAIALGRVLDSFVAAMRAKITSLMALAVASPPTSADTAAHINELVSLGQQGFRAVLVAHSQGNLFANAAYQGYLSHGRAAGAAAGEDTGYVAAKVVHIAPASAVVSGPVVLAEIDAVIEAVRRVDGTPVPANTLSASVMPRSSVDYSGHRLIETYLDPQRPARGVIKQSIFDSLGAL